MEVVVVPLTQQLTSLSINPNGPQVVLAAKRGLFLLNLNNPFDQPTAFKHNTKWEVTDVVWNPHKERAHWIASTSNQKVLVWNVDPSGSMQIANSFASNTSTPTIMPSTPAQASQKSFRTPMSVTPSRSNGPAAASSVASTLLQSSNQPFQTSQNVELVLHSHKRAVSDFHWNPFKPDIIATCGYDNYVHVWDLRERSGTSSTGASGSTDDASGVHGEKGASAGRSAVVISKPEMSFCSWTSGATAVKWNRLSEHILASSHDTDVRIWDTRNPGKEVQIINAAHTTKIYGIDWSPRVADELVTCSQDMCAKFWNLADTRRSEGTIVTGSPVWRARFTPFGSGVVTMPLRKDHELTLWSRDNLAEPIATFSGHTDVVKEFVWRNYGDNDFQLITWSKDQTLRLWPVDKKIQKAIGHNPRRHSSHTTLTALYATAGFDPNITPTQSAISSPVSHHSSSIPGANATSTKAQFSDSIIGNLSSQFEASSKMPLIVEPETHQVGTSIESQRSSRPSSRLLSGGKVTKPALLRESAVSEKEPGESSDTGSHTQRGFGPASVRSHGSGSDVENELTELARLIRKFNQALSVDNVDIVGRTISITLRRLYINPDSSTIHVNIVYQDESRSVPASPLEGSRKILPTSSNNSSSAGQLQQNNPSTTLTQYPTFEIVKSGMVPMAQRQHLSMRLSTLTNFLLAKRIPTLEPCLRFLVYDDVNFGIDRNSTSFVYGIDSIVGVPSRETLNRNVSGFFPVPGGADLYDDEGVVRSSSGGFRSSSGGFKQSSLGGEERLLGTSYSSEKSGGIAFGIAYGGSGGSTGAGGGTGLNSGGNLMIVGSHTSVDGMGSHPASGKSAIPGSYDDTSSSDGSDGRFESSRIGSGSGVRQGYQQDNNFRDKKNIPYPRLCGATFSMSGHLVCFFSPLPHPAATKFAVVAWSVRKQTSVATPINFTTQPASYSMYELYLSHLIEKFPKQNVPNLNNDGLIPTSSSILPSTLFGQNQENWVGLDEEEDGETSLQTLMMGPQRDSKRVTTRDLLSRLRQYGVIKPIHSSPVSVSGKLNEKEETSLFMSPRKASKTDTETGSVSSCGRKRDSLSRQPPQLDSRKNSFNETRSTNSPTIAPRRQSIFTVGSVEGGLSDLGTSSHSLSIVPNVDTLGNIAPAGATGVSHAKRVRAKSVQESSIAGSFASDISTSPKGAGGRMSPAPAQRRASANSNSANVTPESSFTSSRRNPLHEDHWRSDLPAGGGKAAPSFGGLVGEEELVHQVGLRVFIKDARYMMPVSEVLAKEYTLDKSDPVEICSFNSIVAANNKRPDLAKLWTMAGLILARVSGFHDDSFSVTTSSATSSRKNSVTSAAGTSHVSNRRMSLALAKQLQNDPKNAGKHIERYKDQLKIAKDGTFATSKQILDGREQDIWLRADWGHHPLGRMLVDKMFRYLERLGDVQSLALLSCVFSEPFGKDAPLDNFDDCITLRDTTTLSNFPTIYATSSVASTSYQSANNANLYSPGTRPTKRNSTPNPVLNLGIPIKSNRLGGLARTNSAGRLSGSNSNIPDAPMDSFSDGHGFPTAAGSDNTTANPAAGRLPTQYQHHIFGRISGTSSSPGAGDRLLNSSSSGGGGGGGAAVPARRHGNLTTAPSNRPSLPGSLTTPRSYMPAPPLLLQPGGLLLDPSTSKSATPPSYAAAVARSSSSSLPYPTTANNLQDDTDVRLWPHHLPPPRPHATGRLGSGTGDGSGAGGGVGLLTVDAPPREETGEDGYVLPLLDPERAHVFAAYKLFYADMLFGWGLLDQRALVLRFIRGGGGAWGEAEACLLGSLREEGDGDDEVKAEEGSGGGGLVTCSVCRLPCRGLLSSCCLCGHGGHIAHMEGWFGRGTDVECAIGGCGCLCCVL
ncbi:hypothetical protein BC830DRAFT_1212928 [Chytriomyces sp. MP71]|nr:hypothetical protein BC830DRAFT_1212928 [Chytriomyces sp. MP71]